MYVAASLLVASLALQDSGSADTSRAARLTALPIVSWSEVTGVQYGATALRPFRVDSAARASSVSAYAAHTSKGHSKAFAQVDRWSRGDARRVRARLDYISYPLPYFGIGPDTPDDAEEWYSIGAATLHAQVMARWRRPATYLSLGVRVVHAQVREVDPDGQLRDAAGDRWDTRHLEAGVVIDSRDHVSAPRSGRYVRALIGIPLGDGASRLTYDGRFYLRLPGAQSIAVQVQYDHVGAGAPFDQLAMLGADTAMRGYARGRYRDRTAFTTQVEYRSAWWRRAGMVAFAGAGAVSPGTRVPASGPWYPTLGLGLRALLVPRDRTIARADLGFGRGALGVSVGIGEAF